MTGCDVLEVGSLGWVGFGLLGIRGSVGGRRRGMESGFDVVAAAKGGDERAWRELVDTHGPRIWAVARAHRLNDADAGDVFQATWLNLAEHLHGIRDSEKISAWLATVAKRECLRVIELRRPVPVRWLPEPLEQPEHVVVKDDQDRRLWLAFQRLPEQCQRLLRLYAYAPDYSYEQLAEALGMEVSSVGSTKGRCLKALRRKLERRVFDEVDPMPSVIAIPQQPRVRFAEVAPPATRNLCHSLRFAHKDRTVHLELGLTLHGLVSPVADVQIWWPDGMVTAEVDACGLFTTAKVPAGPVRLEVDGVVTDWFVK
jgi:RNA polymerase sigma factor (sigma-70 family)